LCCTHSAKGKVNAEPASVATTPAGETVRTRLLLRSATTIVPLLVKVIPAGSLNAAFVPASVQRRAGIDESG